MAVGKKSRRKLHVLGRDFLWYVGDGAIHVYSSNKTFNIRFPFYRVVENQKTDSVVVVIGGEFAGPPIKGNSHRVFVCPNWFEGSEEIKPSHIRAIIEWSLNIEPDENREEIQESGQRVIWGA